MSVLSCQILHMSSLHERCRHYLVKSSPTITRIIYHLWHVAATSVEQMPGLELVWEALRQTGTTRHAPLLLKHGVCNPQSIAIMGRTLCAEGLPKCDLEKILAWLSPKPGVAVAKRADHPVLWQPDSVAGTRASFTLALQAAAPNQRKRSLEELEKDVLANSTKPSQDSRIRTYLALCTAWEVSAFPLSPECIKAVGASLKAGAYRSPQLYFQAAINHQVRRYGLPVEPYIRAIIKDVNRSIKRGLGPAKLKAGFNVYTVASLVDQDDTEPFSLQRLPHVADVILLGCWFMMRELEMSSARDSYLWLDGNEVTMMIPLHKTSIQSSLTTRTLTCACSVRLSPMCPWHAAERHLVRLSQHPAKKPGTFFPLFPGEDGEVVTKYKTNAHLRAALTTAGISTTMTDANGHSHELYGGHSLRVSGAQFLAAAGVELSLIQLLGRWSSTAVERYTQEAALSIVPQVPQKALGMTASQVTGVAPRIALSAAGGTVTPMLAAPATPSGVTAKSTKDDGKISQLQTQLASLQISVEALKSSIKTPEEVLIVRPQRHVVHKGATDEHVNNPQVWRTLCGWSYGVSKFFRVQGISPPFRRCAKCFHDAEAQSSDHGSEGGSTSSESTGSHSSDV